jgi:hypothetical protein
LAKDWVEVFGVGVELEEDQVVGEFLDDLGDDFRLILAVQERNHLFQNFLMIFIDCVAVFQDLEGLVS